MSASPVEPATPSPTGPVVEAPALDLHPPEPTRADPRARREALVWWAFGLAGVLYLIAAIQDGDPFVIGGTALWLAAVVGYLLPTRR